MGCRRSGNRNIKLCNGNEYEQIDFLDFKEKGHREIPGFTIYEEEKEDLHHFFKKYDEVIVATGENDLREKKVLQLIDMNIQLATMIHPTATISSYAKISQGCTILAHTAIKINAYIGMGCIVNTGAIIEHDCIVNNFVNICPAVAMAGHVVIGYKTFMGIASTVIDDVTIGENVTIGAGATVIGNIPDNSVAVGIPAKVIKVKTNKQDYFECHRRNEE